MAENNGEELIEQLPRRYGGIEIPPCPPANQPIQTLELETLPRLEAYELPALEGSIVDQLEASTGFRVEVGLPPEAVDSDYAIKLFSLFKQYGQEAALEELDAFRDSLRNNPAIRSSEIIGPYFNIRLAPESIGTSIVQTIESMGENYGRFNEGDAQVVVLDTSSPNIAKEMTVAHLRSTVIGEALGRIYQNCGYTVIRDNHLGDWGTQFGILGRAYELWSKEVPDLQEGGDPIKGLLELYVRMNKAIEDEEKGRQASDLKEQGLEWFRKLEEGDPEARAMWLWALDISLAEAQQIYERLGSNFEYILGESQYVSMLPSVIESLHQVGLAQIDDKERTVINFSEDSKMGPLTIQKSDGTSLYSTRDLATLAARNAWFGPSKILYVVGGEQSHYFERVFEAFRLYSQVVNEQPSEMEHIAFGMVRLPEGKMSTRRGNAIFLEDVINEAVSRVKPTVEKHSQETDGELSPEMIDDIAEKVGVGAVIYSELRQNRGRGIEFNWDEILSSHGNSGPYLQYTNARINAIFRKLDPGYEIDYEPSLTLDNELECKLALELGRFPGAIQEAIDKNEPSLVAQYLYRLASAYNGFYKRVPVLDSPNKAIMDSRLRLCGATSVVLRNGMNLLGIPIPERM